MILRKGAVWYAGEQAGYIEEHEDHYEFYYLPEYLTGDRSCAVSLTLPLQTEPFKSPQLFSFFDGLIPEGWLLDIAEKNWKLNPRDRMGLLLACCKDTIGAVTVTNGEVSNRG